MDIVITIFIIIGSVLMVTNIIRYLLFLKTTHDVLSSGSKRDRVWKYVAMVLLIFFLIGYLFIAIFSDPDMMMAMILFGGSIFVAIVLTLMFNLLDTAKTRSIDIAEVLVGVIDARDPNLNGHSRHVQELTMLFYRYLPNWMKNDINPVSLEYAALMHDVGKLGVPESILNKPAKLNDDEWEIMRAHPRVGVQILEPLHTFDHIADWILYHHERIDGSGYPLHAKSITIESQILELCEFLDENLCGIGCKRGKVHDIIQYIRAMSGVLFSQEAVDSVLTFTAVYPVGTTLKLSNGAIGVVIKQNEHLVDRPVLQLTKDENGKSCKSKTIIDLSEIYNLVVDSVLD